VEDVDGVEAVDHLLRWEVKVVCNHRPGPHAIGVPVVVSLNPRAPQVV